MLDIDEMGQDEIHDWIDSWGRAEVISIYRIESGEMSGRTTDGVSSR